MRKINNLVLLFSIPFSSLAFGQSLPPSPIREIEAINKDMAILSKKTEYLHLKTTYEDALKRSGDSSSKASPDAPEVLAIEGIDGDYIVICATVNGNRITRSQGEVVGGWKVEKITAKDVVFSRGKSRIQVPVSFSTGQMPSLPLPSQDVQFIKNR